MTTYSTLLSLLLYYVYYTSSIKCFFDNYVDLKSYSIFMIGIGFLRYVYDVKIVYADIIVMKQERMSFKH